MGCRRLRQTIKTSADINVIHVLLKSIEELVPIVLNDCSIELERERERERKRD